MGKQNSAVKAPKVSLRDYAGLSEVIAELGLGSLVMNLLGLALPLALLQIYDRVIANQSVSTLGLLLGGVVIALALDAVMKVMRGYITGWLGARFEHRVSCAAFAHLLGTPLAAYEREEGTTHLERIRTAAQVRDFYSGNALLVLFDLPFVAIYLLVIGLIGGALVLVPVVLLGLFILVTVIVGRQLRDGVARRVGHDERRYGFLAETLRGIHTVKTMAMEALMHRRYEMLQGTGVEHGSRAVHGSVTAVNMGALFGQVMTVAVVAAGALAVINGQMTPGGLAACMILAGRALQPLRSGLSVWMRFQSFALAREQLAKLFRLPFENAASRPPLPDLRGGVELRAVSVVFDGTERPLFSNLSLRVEPGQCVAITGDSGCGKSSLLALISAALRPAGGQVLLDGQDVNAFDPSTVHRGVAYLPQQGSLFNGTILQNITMFDDTLNNQALDIARKLGLDRAVAGMRHGFETQVGDGAAETMPAGVRQRVAIARALIHDPKVILFDEANIAIDQAGDDQLIAHLKGLIGTHTIILVTHRLSLLRMANRVLSLKDGRLVEHTAEERAHMQAGPDPAPTEDYERSTNWSMADSISRFPVPSDFALCLPGMLTALGWQGSPRALAEALPHMVDSLDLSGFRSVMANLGFRSDGVRASISGLDMRLLPCLFVPDNGPARVLLRHDEGVGVTAFNGETAAVERIGMPNEAGTAFVFKPLDPKLVAPGEEMGWTRRILSRFRPMYWLVLGITMVINVLVLATPLFVMTIYDRVIPSRDIKLEALLVLGVALALALDWALRNLRSRILSFVAGRTEFIISNSIFQRVLSLPVSSVEKVSVGAQISRIKDLESLREFFVGPMALLLYDIPAISVFVIAITLLNPWLILVVLGALAAFALLGAVSQPVLAQSSAVSARVGMDKQEFLAEALSNLRSVRLVGADSRWMERYRDLSGRAVMAEFKAQQQSSRVAAIAQFLATCTGVAALAVSTISAINGDITVGVIVASMMIMWRLVSPLQSGFLAATALVRVGRSVRQIDNLMRLKAEREDTARQHTRPESRGEIAFARVSFRYSMEADPALLGVTFTVPAGKVAAIAGPNGSGKSTLLKLLVRAYHPQAGSIRIDNVDIRQIDPTDLRTLVSYVPQRCELFYGTVAQNLRLVHPTASDEDIAWSLRMAGLYDDVARLPQGFDTRISDSKADQLSNGFRQRLSLARAYLKPAPVLLFDEPGNGLDNDGDRAFTQAVEYLRGASTIFIVSHRPSHLRLADMVIYLENGAVRAVGPYEQLQQQITAGLQ